MTLPAVPPIKASDINVELGRAANAAFDINGASERALAGVPSGAIKFSDFLGKSSRSATLVHTSSSASEVANFGTDTPGRWIAILAVGGNNNNPYNLGADISGVPGTVIKAHSTGDGLGGAHGTAIIVGQPSGSSGVVTLTHVPSGGAKFYVVRFTGYNLGSAVFAADSAGSGIPPWSVNVPANGLTLGIINNNGGLGAISWTGLTEQIPDANLVSGGICSAAWDINMAANPSKSIDVTASDNNGASSACIASFNPS